MGQALLDSNVLIGLASARDQYHEQSRSIIRGFDSNELPEALVTNYVLAEALGYVHSRISQETATDMYERVKTGAGFEIVVATREDFATAESVFMTQRPLSFVDATIVAIARRTGTDVLYSFDDDFDRFECLSRLATAENPFTP